jgi:3',5'-cyclic AMP phosphodiesterase CpdA
MLRILHISDFHFGPPYVPHVGEALIQLAPDLQPDAVVVSGDLTQRAKPAQFVAARQFIDRLPDVPKIVVPGNHDVPLYRVAERLLQPLGCYRQYISGQLNQVWRLAGAVIVALNSTAPYRAIVNGRIRREQLDFCAEAFRDAPPGTARIVVAHHHFVPAPDHLRDKTMRQAKRAVRCFLDLGVELVLGGHLHRAFIGNSRDHFPGGSQDRGILIVHCGTSTSRRGRGRERHMNSCNLVDIAPTTLQVTPYMYDDTVGQFGPVGRHLYPRAGRGFVADSDGNGPISST